MADYTAELQQLYVAYFNRPADYDGLAFWNNQVSSGKATLASVAAAFAADTEYKQTFAGMDNAHIVAQVYLNLFGKTLDKIDNPGFNFWLNALNNKILTIDNVVTGIAAGAKNPDGTLNADGIALKDKVEAATTFTKSLDTVAKQVGYKGAYAMAQAKLWLSGIVDDATLKAAVEPAALSATITKVTTPYIPPVSVALTAGVDTPAFTGGDDTVLATSSVGDKNNLTAFDNVDAGAGVDTIKFIDTGTATGTQFNPVVAGATVSNVEVVSIATTGGVSANTTTWTGVTDVQVTAAGTAAVGLTVADTTNVTVASATTGTTGVTGGKAVSVALSAAGAGDVTVTGAALTNVTVKGGAIATVDNVDAKAVSAKGTTLTSVTLDGVIGATAALKGASLTNVTLKNIAQATTVTVTNATASHALNLTVDAAGKTAAPAAVVTVVDGEATTLNVAAAGASNIALSAAKATKLNVTGEKALTADVTASAKLTTIDASAAKGAVTLTGIANTVTAITGGEGADTLTVTTATVKDNTATTADETVNATVNTNGGDDKITVNVTGDGKVLLNTGAGADTVTIAGRGTAVLDVKLGDGNDTFDAAVAINGTDSIDAGAGTDTLALKLVGSANIGAFAGFDVFDAKALAGALDVDILAVKNTVTEFVASGATGAGATLQNIGAGVGFRATADMGATGITLTQKAAGALTVTVDADETGTATDGAELWTATVTASNATALKAVFDTTFLASNTAEKALLLDNQSTLNLAGTAATSLEVVSGGNGTNVLNYDANAKATSVTATGAAALTANIANTKVATFDASGLTGGLTISTVSLADGGKVVLGGGTDKVTVAASSTTAAYEGVQGFQKSGAIVVSAEPADATAKAAAIKAADTLVFGAGDMVVANANAGVTTGTIAKGVLTFTGAGPATLADAFLIADAAAETANEVVVFQYLGDSYAFVQGGVGADIAVKLVGMTGITQLAEIAPDAFTLI